MQSAEQGNAIEIKLGKNYIAKSQLLVGAKNLKEETKSSVSMTNGHNNQT